MKIFFQVKEVNIGYKGGQLFYFFLKLSGLKSKFKT